MKRKIALLIAVILCLSLVACSKEPEPEQSPQEIQTETTDTGAGTEEMQQQSNSSAHSGNAAEKSEEPAQQSIELVGPWHLDGKKNDLAMFSDRFPGYAEWGASMEIRSDGQMSWYIGAEGWHGTYVVDGETLHAELDSELEELTLPWDFHIAIENESAMLEMDYEDMTIYWVYGDQEESVNGTDSE